MDEGYIKFTHLWIKKPVTIPGSILDELNDVRQELKRLGMVGKIPDGPSFGNLSVRHSKTSFFITGSDTGGFDFLSTDQIALVTESIVSSNRISSIGLIAASSESMSHAAIYQSCEDVKAIIHFHHLEFWSHFLGKLPTTSSDIPYGTPELAMELGRMIHEKNQSSVIVLGGHHEGVISYGTSLQNAFKQLLALHESINEKTRNLFVK